MAAYQTIPNCNTCPSCVPHRCPVCHGRGLVDQDFYQDFCSLQPWQAPQWGSATATPIKTRATCRSCNGSGVVFGCVGRQCP